MPSQVIQLLLVYLAASPITVLILSNMDCSAPYFVLLADLSLFSLLSLSLSVSFFSPPIFNLVTVKPKPLVLSRPGVPFLLVIFACGCVRPLLLPSAGVNTLSNPVDDLGVTLCRSADKRSVVLLQTNWEDNGALKRVTELDGPSASGCKVQHHNVCQDNVPDPGHYVPGISAGRNDIRDLGRQVPSPCVGCNGAPGYGADRDGALASVCEVSGHGAGQDGTPGP